MIHKLNHESPFCSVLKGRVRIRITERGDLYIHYFRDTNHMFSLDLCEMRGPSRNCSVSCSVPTYYTMESCAPVEIRDKFILLHSNQTFSKKICLVSHRRRHLQLRNSSPFLYLFPVPGSEKDHRN